MFERPSRKTRENDRFLRADIIEHAEDLDLELIDAISHKDGSSGAAHTGFDVLQREERSLGRQSSG